MFRVKTYNKISNLGLDIFPKDKYSISPQEARPEAIVLRSYNMHNDELPNELLVVGRAGAGVNNVPVDKCTQKGVVVFNAPGANANAVKELVLAGLFISSRNIYEAALFSKTLSDKGDDVSKIVEKEKSRFVGPEIYGKKLGLIGLGAIGSKVADNAISLGMEVIGYDPYLPAEIVLSTKVKKVDSLKELLEVVDYLSLHVPVNESTKNMLNKNTFATMKKGVRILNFSRGGLVCEDGLEMAIKEGIVSYYVTDFASAKLLNMDKVLALPHLGASTPEAEENCAIMIANQTRDFMENGNIKNSVNFPQASLTKSTGFRITVASAGDDHIEEKVIKELENAGSRVKQKVTSRKGNIQYGIFDCENEVSADVKSKIEALVNVLRVRVVK